ncbi:MAG: hypothetical protein KJ901_22560 [Gammaproteobacteria bacterium]|nr:hypothetical protein [Gammaproteobacteria bacterium]
MEYIDYVQWPAFVASVAAAWLVASSSKQRRNAGFWVFLLSNVLWVIWGLHSSAYALIALQVCLALMNFRGLRNTESREDTPASHADEGTPLSSRRA